MSKGTVFYIGGFELPDKNAAALRVLANGKILRNLGYEVVFIGIDTALPVGSAAMRSDHSGFECWAVPYPRGTLAWLKYLVGLPAVLDVLNAERDVKPVAAICYNYPAVASLRIQQACRRLDIKALADATEWYDATGGSLSYRLIKYVDTTLRMHVVHPRTQGVITTSRYLTDFYQRRGKATVELPTLFDGDRFKAPPLVVEERAVHFIYVGSPFDAGKVNRSRTNLKERLDTCIQLFHALFRKGSAFRFDVYGITQADYLRVFPEHEQMLSDMLACVAFHGRKPNQQVLNCIASSDFSIFFRDRTRVTLAGFPSKLAESISAGTPVVSNQMPSLESFAASAGVVLAKPGDELRVVEALLAMTRAEIDTMKQQAFESKTFHYDNYRPHVAEFMQEVGA